LILLSLIFR